MATTGTTSTGIWSYRRLLVAVLTVSVVLNLFFIAGGVWSRMHEAPQARAGDQRYQRMAAELDLDAKQRADFQRYVAALRTRSEKTQQQVAPLLAAAWDESGKPQADRAQVLRLFTEALDKRQQAQQESITQMLDFLATLPPEQRAKFVALARERRGAWRSSAAPNR